MDDMRARAILKSLAVFSLLSVLIFAAWVNKGIEASWASAPAEEVGYEKAILLDEDSEIPSIAGGYTSLNPQIFFEGRQTVRSLAKSITQGIDGDLGKALAISKWVFLHVRPQTAAPPIVIGDDYYNTMRRGWGFCDQMAHVYAAIATYADLPSRQLQLFRDGYGSPHTLAESFIDGKWVIVATWRGFVPLNDKGNPMSKEELANSMQMNLFEGLYPNDFLNAQPFYSYPYASTSTVVNRAFNRVKISFNNLLESEPAAVNPANPPGDGSSTGTTGEPSSKPIPLNDINVDEIKKLDEARRLHLKFDFLRAINLYQEVEAASDLRIRYQAQFWKMVANYDLGSLEEAEKLIKEYGGNPKDPYRISYLRYQAEIFLKKGLLESARAVLESMDTPQARADLIRLGFAN